MRCGLEGGGGGGSLLEDSVKALGLSLCMPEKGDVRNYRRGTLMSGTSASAYDNACGREACCLTSPLPGTIIAETVPLTFFPSTNPATARRSSILEFVHEPMKTRSIWISFTGTLASSPMYSKARWMDSLSAGSLMPEGSGTLPLMSVTIPGLVPQVT